MDVCKWKQGGINFVLCLRVLMHSERKPGAIYIQGQPGFVLLFEKNVFRPPGQDAYRISLTYLCNLMLAQYWGDARRYEQVRNINTTLFLVD